jgi:hypothetical protein
MQTIYANRRRLKHLHPLLQWALLLAPPNLSLMPCKNHHGTPLGQANPTAVDQHKHKQLTSHPGAPNLVTW